MPTAQRRRGAWRRWSFQFSIWDARSVCWSYSWLFCCMHFQFSIWDAMCLRLIEQFRQLAVTFNSLFEMRPAGRGYKCRRCGWLSILYLRCPEAPDRSVQRPHIRLSILYLRCTSTSGSTTLCATAREAFNSLFEMHKEDGIVKAAFFCDTLSILYLRCQSGKTLIDIGLTYAPFNSLFEMPVTQTWRNPLSRLPFNSLFEMRGLQNFLLLR